MSDQPSTRRQRLAAKRAGKVPAKPPHAGFGKRQAQLAAVLRKMSDYDRKWGKRFPAVRYEYADNHDPTIADSELVQATRTFFNEYLDYDNPDMVPEWEKRCLMSLKRKGVMECASVRDVERRIEELKVFFFGDLLFKYLRTVRSRHPRNNEEWSVLDSVWGKDDVQIFMEPDCLRVRFCAVKEYGPKKSPCFYSDTGPICSMDGQEKKLSYTLETFNRVAERSVVCPMGYTGYGDVFNLLYYANSVVAKPARLKSNRKRSVCLWQPINDPGHPSLFIPYRLSLLLDALGERFDGNRRYHLLLGYCPVDDEEIEQDGKALWQCRTFLLPGYAGTPERKILADAVVNHDDRSMIEESLRRSQSYKDMVENSDLRAFAWFHRNGCPKYTIN